MKKTFSLLGLIFLLQGCSHSENAIPKNLTSSQSTSETNSKTVKKEETLRQDQNQIIKEGINRRDKKQTQNIFIETYDIFKTLPSTEAPPYIEVLTKAKNIPEVTQLWEAIDKELSQKNDTKKQIKKIESLEKNCLKINYCQSNQTLTTLLSQLKTGVQNHTSPKALSKKLNQYTHLYINETNKPDLPHKASSKIAESITKNFFERQLTLKKLSKTLCPNVKEDFKTSQEYEKNCGKKAMKKFEEYKQKVKKEENIDPQNEMCIEFMEVLKESQCEAINTQYKIFRKDFLEEKIK